MTVGDLKVGDKIAFEEGGKALMTKVDDNYFIFDDYSEAKHVDIRELKRFFRSVFSDNKLRPEEIDNVISRDDIKLSTSSQVMNLMVNTQSWTRTYFIPEEDCYLSKCELERFDSLPGEIICQNDEWEILRTTIPVIEPSFVKHSFKINNKIEVKESHYRRASKYFVTDIDSIINMQLFESFSDSDIENLFE